MECGSACGERNGVLAADLLGGEAFDLVDVRADGAHPVGFVSLGDVPDFVAVHRWAREPDLLLETRHKTVAPSGYSGPKARCFNKFVLILVIILSHCRDISQ